MNASIRARVGVLGALVAAVACGPSVTVPEAPDSTAATPASGLADTNAVPPAIAVNAKPMSARISPSKDETLTVVVELSGDSIAVVRSQAPDLTISQSTEQSVADALRTQQASLIGTIEAMGGHVLATFQHAINGIKVSIPASRLGSLKTCSVDIEPLYHQSTRVTANVERTLDRHVSAVARLSRRGLSGRKIAARLKIPAGSVFAIIKRAKTSGMKSVRFG